MRISKTDPPSPQSAADSKTGSSSSSAAAARSSSGRVGGALVSQPRLLQIPLSAHNSPILFCLSPPAAAFERASPPAHLTRSSARGPQSAAARSSSQSAQSPSGARSSSSGQSPGLGAAAPVSLDSPLPARIRRFFVPLRPPLSAAALPRQHLPFFLCLSGLPPAGALPRQPSAPALPPPPASASPLPVI